MPAIEKFFLASFYVYIGGQYLLPFGFLGDILFYGTMLPAFIAYYRHSLKNMVTRDDSISRLVFLLFAYTIAHTFIVKPIEWRSFSITGSTITNFIFFIYARDFFARGKWHDGLFKAIMIAASCGALISIADYMLNYNMGERLKPWNTSNHEITGASVYAICCLPALYLFRITQSIRAKALYIAPIAAITIVTILSQSRGPLLALACSGLFLGIAYYRLRFLLLFLGACICAAVILYFGDDHLPTSARDLLASITRPDSYRASIFMATLDRIMEKPWLGHGMRTYFDHHIARHPHNLYLGTAYYLGLPGIVMLIALTCLGFYTVIKSHADKAYRYLVLAMLIYGITASLTDNARIVHSPSGVWMFFWLPFAMAAALGGRAKLPTYHTANK